MPTQVDFTDPQSKTTLGGKPVYGMFFQGDDSHGMHYVGQGYSNRTARGTAVGDEPQTTYALFSGRRYNGNCCFDCAPAPLSAQREAGVAVLAVPPHSYLLLL